MKRLLTAAVGVPLALLATFRLPAFGFLLLVAVVVTWAAVEYVRLARHYAPRAPLGVLTVLVPAASVVLWWILREHAGGAPLDSRHLGLPLLGVLLVLGVGLGSLVLLARTPIEEAVPALGILSFGLPYFVAPIVALVLLQQVDPWLLFLLYAIVWLGDTAAFYVGTAWGRRRFAPVVSPKKSWEGALAGLAAGLLSTLIWSLWRLDRLDWALLAVAAVTAVAAQIGDLVESLIKRGAGVKDSGHTLPGHGGLLDRMDAMLFAAPVFLLGLWCAGIGARVP
jgi:phosphatidate cytidylyltransferase